MPPVKDTIDIIHTGVWFVDGKCRENNLHRKQKGGSHLRTVLYVKSEKPQHFQHRAHKEHAQHQQDDRSKELAHLHPLTARPYFSQWQ